MQHDAPEANNDDADEHACYFHTETSGRMVSRFGGIYAAWPQGAHGQLGVWDLAQHPVPQGGADLPWLFVSESVGLEPALGGRRRSKCATRVQAPDFRLQGGAGH
jgi:hypothetical protein